MLLFTLVLQMKINGIYIALLVAFISCGSKEKSGEGVKDTTNAKEGKLVYRNVQLNITAITCCRYNEKDVLYSKKKNQKLILFEIAVRKISAADKMNIVPEGAILVDSKGNTYSSWPGAIAIAQGSKCISGDDLADYNNIWNGQLITGETQKAFVLGFELPEDARIEKLYWNHEWKKQEIYFSLDKNIPAINY